MKFNEEQLTHWMQLVRTYPDALEAFWPSQVKSKSWIANTLEFQTIIDLPMSAVIFGSWYGVLGVVVVLVGCVGCVYWGLVL